MIRKYPRPKKKQRKYTPNGVIQFSGKFNPEPEKFIIDKDFIYKGKLLEDHLKDMILMLFGKKKFKEYEEYLKTQEILKKIDGNEKEN